MNYNKDNINNLDKNALESLIKEIMNEEFKFIILNGGKVASTLLLEKKDKKFILQIWRDDYSNQSIKKHYIYSLLKKSGIKVPRVINYGVVRSFTFLLTSYIKGKTLHDVEYDLSKANCQKVMKEVGVSLSTLHKITLEKDYFGWLNGNMLDKKFPNLESYLESELRRFELSLENKISKEVWSNLELVIRRSIQIISKYSCVPTLNWYDIQSNNVLVEKENEVYSLTGFLDPGAARFGIPEWDIAHAKIHLCRNRDDLNSLIEGYGCNKLNQDITDAFIPIILVDDLSLGYDRGWQFVIDQTILRLKKLLILT